MSKPVEPAGGDALRFYEKLVATNPAVERRGASMPYTSVNGHMFSFLTKSGKLALRLPDAAREVFLRKHRGQLCEQNGVVMKEYVEVPDPLLRKTAQLKEFFDLSFSYVSSLKPKPTARKRK